MEHNVGEMHPESPAHRLIAIRDQLKASQIFDSLDEIEAPQASDEQIARVHTPRYIEYLELSQPLIGTPPAWIPIRLCHPPPCGLPGGPQAPSSRPGSGM